MTPDDLLNLKRETAEVEQRGVRTRGYQEIHVTRLDRFPASYRTEHTHITQAALGRGREDLPPSRPKGSTTIADLTLKLLVGRVGLEPTTGGL